MDAEAIASLIASFVATIVLGGMAVIGIRAAWFAIEELRRELRG